MRRLCTGVARGPRGWRPRVRARATDADAPWRAETDGVVGAGVFQVIDPGGPAGGFGLVLRNDEGVDDALRCVVVLTGSQVGPVVRASATPSCQIEPFPFENMGWTRGRAAAKTARRRADSKARTLPTTRAGCSSPGTHAGRSGIEQQSDFSLRHGVLASLYMASPTPGLGCRTDPRLSYRRGPDSRCRSSSSPDTVPPPRPYERTTRDLRDGDILPRPKPRPTTLPTSCAARRADSPSPIASAPTTSSAGASRRERRGRGRGRLLRFIGSTAARRRRSRRMPRPAPLPPSRGRDGTPDAVPPEPA